MVKRQYTVDAPTAELHRLGLLNVRVIVNSRLRDTINRIVPLGSFQPATIVARKF